MRENSNTKDVKSAELTRISDYKPLHLHLCVFLQDMFQKPPMVSLAWSCILLQLLICSLNPTV